jgi:hypothetical protein
MLHQYLKYLLIFQGSLVFEFVSNPVSEKVNIIGCETHQSNCSSRRIKANRIINVSKQFLPESEFHRDISRFLLYASANLS